jgi:hypothetical protein
VAAIVGGVITGLLLISILVLSKKNFLKQRNSTSPMSSLGTSLLPPCAYPFLIMLFINTDSPGPPLSQTVVPFTLTPWNASRTAGFPLHSPIVSVSHSVPIISRSSRWVFTRPAIERPR